MAKPVVALVGRPNVGKSTLFNRLTGERLAIVDDVPGTTRDRLLSEAEWTGHYFYVMDTGGIDPSKNRNPGPPFHWLQRFHHPDQRPGRTGDAGSDLILFIVDGQVGVTPADHEIANILRRKQHNVDGKLMPPILLVVNKAESAKIRQIVAEFYELGMGEPYAVSALHGTGSGDLLDAMIDNFPEGDDDEDEDDSVKIAIVGKPNAGKSSLLNKMVGQERAIVSEIPGTTRDAIDTKLTLAACQSH